MHEEQLLIDKHMKYAVAVPELPLENAAWNFQVPAPMLEIVRVAAKEVVMLVVLVPLSMISPIQPVHAAAAFVLPAMLLPG